MCTPGDTMSVMNDIVKVCNEKKSCAGIRNLDCKGKTYQTCNALENGTSDKKCTYKRKNGQISIVSKQPIQTTRVPNLIDRITKRQISNVSDQQFQSTGAQNLLDHSINTTVSKLSPGPVYLLQMREQELYISISVALIVLALLVSILTFYIKRRGSSAENTPVANRELSYEDDGYDLADTYATTNDVEGQY